MKVFRQFMEEKKKSKELETEDLPHFSIGCILPSEPKENYELIRVLEKKMTEYFLDLLDRYKLTEDVLI